jgi:hypothetical protein
MLAAPEGLRIPTVTTLSADGRTLTITPLSLPIPTTLTAALTSGVTDVAGNALVVPADTWWWELPAWQDLGTFGFNHRGRGYIKAIALDEAGTPIIGYLHRTSDSCESEYSGEIGFSKWDGTSLARSPVLFLGRDHVGDSASIDLDSAGRPTIAWSEGLPYYDVVPYARAARWEGSQWALYPDLRVDGFSKISRVTIGINAEAGDDRAVIAWVETTGTVQKLYARRWTGAEWEELHGNSVLWQDAVATLDTTIWEEFGDLQIAFDDVGEPVFYWHCDGDDPTLRVIHAASWRTYGFCDSVGVPTGVFEYRYRAPSSGTCPVHHAYTVRTAAGGHLLYAKAAGAMPNFALNVDPDATAEFISIDVDREDAPTIAWLERTDLIRRGHARRWGPQGWEHIGSFDAPQWTWRVSSLRSASRA